MNRSPVLTLHSKPIPIRGGPYGNKSDKLSNKI